jgi:hypothetical protein
MSVRRPMRLTSSRPSAMSLYMFVRPREVTRIASGIEYANGSPCSITATSSLLFGAIRLQQVDSRFQAKWRVRWQPKPSAREWESWTERKEFSPT